MLLRHERRWPNRWYWWAASLVVVAIGVLLLIWGLRGPSVGPSIPGPIGNTSMAAPATAQLTAFPSTSSPAAPAVATLASYTASPSSASAHRVSSHATGLNPSRPVHLTIPKIGVSTSVVELGLNANGTVQVPDGWHIAGWYKYGPIPGQLGSAVILGHVDSVNGPAVFYRLVDLRPGNRLSVRLADGQLINFAVIGLREYTKSSFPDKLVYGPRSYDALQLVTCGGNFDYSTHHYVSNIVVFTKRVY